MKGKIFNGGVLPGPGWIFSEQLPCGWDAHWGPEKASQVKMFLSHPTAHWLQTFFQDSFSFLLLKSFLPLFIKENSPRRGCIPRPMSNLHLTENEFVPFSRVGFNKRERFGRYWQMGEGIRIAPEEEIRSQGHREIKTVPKSLFLPEAKQLCIKY